MCDWLELYRVCDEENYKVRGESVSRCFFFQAEDGIRDLVRSRGLGDVYKRQMQQIVICKLDTRRRDSQQVEKELLAMSVRERCLAVSYTHLTLPTSDLV